MMALSNKHYSGHYKTTEEEDDQRTAGRDLEKELWRYRWRKEKELFEIQMEEDGCDSI